jgi:phosphoribosylformylglycinamidine cyclo-ligase
VDRSRIIDGRTCRPGDKVIGLASSGLHSNGYSLARKVFTRTELGARIGARLLRPTRIYTKAILKAMPLVRIKAMAHITGGGFYDNIPRVVPDGMGVRVKKGSWPVPPIFKLIQERGKIADREMYRTLNMGIGMAVVVGPKDAGRAAALFTRLGAKAHIIGEIVRGAHEVTIS